MSEIRTDKFQGSKDDEFLAPFQWIALISLMKITSLGNKWSTDTLQRGENQWCEGWWH